MDTPSSAELKAFDATARTGSMSDAARLLGLRQPTISAHISSLEVAYGVELFHRRGRRVELTEFGAQLYEATGRIYRAEEQAAQLLLSARCLYHGHLLICSIGPYNVTPMIKLFRAAFPSVRVSVTMGDSRNIIGRILQYADDVGVLLHAVDDSRVHCIPFRRQRLIVFAARGHALASKPKLTVTDLEGQEFVMREDGSRTRAVFEAGLQEAGVKVRSSVEMGSREAVKEAVAQGLGLGVVSDSAFAEDHRVVVLPVAGLDLHNHVHVVCLKERLAAPLIHSFIATVATVQRLRAVSGQARP
jgi:aminoethylphosphonate catabolism LysR family transcriptional regulator